MKNNRLFILCITLILIGTACEEDKPNKYTVGPCRSSFWELWAGQDQLTGASNQAIADGYTIYGSWFNYENNKSIRLNVLENGAFQFISSSDLDVAPGGTVKISDIGDDYTSIDGIVFSDSTGNDKTCEGSGTYEYCIGDTLKGGSQYDGNYEIYVNFFSESDNCTPRKALLEAGEKIWFKKL